MKKALMKRHDSEEATTSSNKIYQKIKNTKKGKKESGEIGSNEQTLISEMENTSKSKDTISHNTKMSKIKISKIEKQQRTNKFLGKKKEREDEIEILSEGKYSSIEKSKPHKSKNINLIHLNENEDPQDEENSEFTESITKRADKNKNKTIFVKSYSQKLNEDNINEIFGKFGSISKIKINKNNSCLVEFKEKSTFKYVMKNKNKIYLSGKKLKVAPSIKGIRKNDIFEIKENINENSRNKQINDKRDKIETETDKYIEIGNEKVKIEEVDKYALLDKKIQILSNEVEKNKAEIDNLKMSIGLLTEINNQTEINSKANFNYLNKKLKLMTNAYKILYMRKLANLLLNKIYNKYHSNLIKVRVQVGKIKKDIIVVKENIKTINNIDSIQVNLLIDFLRFIWDHSSSIIHIQDRTFQFQKEILSEYMNISNKGKKLNLEESVELQEIINVIFEKEEEKNSSISNKNNRKDSNLVIAIKRALKRKMKVSPNTDESEKAKSVISLSNSEEAEESNFEISENQLKNFIKEELREININSLLSKLVKKIKINVQGSEIFEDNTIEITGRIYYNVWKETFTKEKYRLKNKYIKYNEMKSIMSLEKMGYYTYQLLEGAKIDFFKDDLQISTKTLKEVKLIRIQRVLLILKNN